MTHLVTRLRQSPLRRLLPAAHRCLSSAASLSASPFPDTQTQKLERIADELLDLNKLERLDYSILFRLRLGLNRWGSAGAGAIPSAGGSPSPADAAAAAAEKTAFDVKLEKFDSSSKLKVIKEVRAFTGLGLKEAKDLVEKTPVVLKKEVSKEDAEMITAKLKEIGAAVVLE